MPEITFHIEDSDVERLHFLAGKMSQNPGLLATEVFQSGLRHIVRKRPKASNTLGDRASEFKEWLELQGYSNNTARTQSSLARKMLKSVLEAREDDDTKEFAQDPMYVAGTMSQPGGARRAWEKWLLFCSDKGYDEFQLEDE